MIRLRVGSFVTLKKITNPHIKSDTELKVISITKETVYLSYNGSVYSTSINNVRMKEFVFR